jgi:hypothetical protein
MEELVVPAANTTPDLLCKMHIYCGAYGLQLEGISSYIVQTSGGGNTGSPGVPLRRPGATALSPSFRYIAKLGERRSERCMDARQTEYSDHIKDSYSYAERYAFKKALQFGVLRSFRSQGVLGSFVQSAWSSITGASSSFEYQATVLGQQYVGWQAVRAAAGAGAAGSAIATAGYLIGTDRAREVLAYEQCQ